MDVQASPKVLQLFGWKRLSAIADSYVEGYPDLEFFPEKWFHGDLEGAPEEVKILFLQLDDLLVEVVPYVDKDGTKVMSFDPSRKVPEDYQFKAKEGQNRLRF